MALSDVVASVVAAYALDEASGNALDASGNGYDGVETSGTIGTGTVFGGNARDFEDGDTEYFEVADNADLSGADIDWCVIAQVQLESKGANRIFLKKGDGDDLEYDLSYQTADDKFQFRVSSGNGFANLADVDDAMLGSPSTATDYLIIAWHDAGANTINICTNNNTPSSNGYTHGLYNSAAPFAIGAYPEFSQYHDGLLREVIIIRGRFLTSDERTELWNDGDPIPFADWDGGGGGVTLRSRLSLLGVGC